MKSKSGEQKKIPSIRLEQIFNVNVEIEWKENTFFLLPDHNQKQTRQQIKMDGLYTTIV